MTARFRRPPLNQRHLPFRDMTESLPTWLRKEDAPCCQARALPDGRPPIGDCGPDCLRRLERQTWAGQEAPIR